MSHTRKTQPGGCRESRQTFPRTHADPHHTRVVRPSDLEPAIGQTVTDLALIGATQRRNRSHRITRPRQPDAALPRVTGAAQCLQVPDLIAAASRTRHHMIDRQLGIRPAHSRHLNPSRANTRAATSCLTPIAMLPLHPLHLLHHPPPHQRRRRRIRPARQHHETRPHARINADRHNTSPRFIHARQYIAQLYAQCNSNTAEERGTHTVRPPSHETRSERPRGGF